MVRVSTWNAMKFGPLTSLARHSYTLGGARLRWQKVTIRLRLRLESRLADRGLVRIKARVACVQP